MRQSDGVCVCVCGGVFGFVYSFNIVVWSLVCIVGCSLLWSVCSLFTLDVCVCVCVRLSFRLSNTWFMCCLSVHLCALCAVFVVCVRGCADSWQDTEHCTLMMEIIRNFLKLGRFVQEEGCRMGGM